MRYERLRYPDGQISVKITDYSNPHIVERINSYEDLMFVKSIADAYHYSVFKQPLTIFIPCLFGQRSDRRFSENQSFDLKIITDIINSCNFSRVEILEPHSDVCMSLINNSHKKDSLNFITQAIDHKAIYANQQIDESLKKDLVLCSPDAGAYKRTFHYGELLELPVVAANKYRDLDGKITLNFIGDVVNKNVLIVDDLLDAGGTYIILGKALKEQCAKNVYLYISHAYFNKGMDELKKNIDHIYCTNSVKDINDDFVTQFKVI